MNDLKHLEALLRHVNNVERNCEILGKRIIESGDFGFGLKLIANGHIHDHSKFRGVEWLYLREGIEGELKQAAIKQHTLTNPHHPEYWGNIKDMPKLYVAEMVCDWAARSSEFGNDLREWIKNKATIKFGFETDSPTGCQIFTFVNMFLDKAF